MKTQKGTIAALLFTVVVLYTVGIQAAIIGISKPVGSDDAACRSLTDGIWSVSTPPYPLTTNSGIGYIINSSNALQPLIDFTIHDHVYVSEFIPDPARAVVTFYFDEPTVVKSLRVIQHINGITKIEGYVGDSLDAMTSIYSVFSNRGDITGASRFTEGEASVFTFTNSRPARYFQFIVRKTSLDGGYAIYRAFPISVSSTQDFRMVALQGNGMLTFETDPARSYDIEWASKLEGTWTNNWEELQQIQPTGAVTTVSVPMFFRVARHEYVPRPGTEIIEIPSDGRTVSSMTVLRSGHRYGLEIFGVYRYDIGEPGQLADAEHIELDDHSWKPNKNISIGGSAGPVVNDGFSLARHAYTYIIHGDARPIALQIRDIGYTDNHGFLYGRIVDLGATR